MVVPPNTRQVRVESVVRARERGVSLNLERVWNNVYNARVPENWVYIFGFGSVRTNAMCTWRGWVAFQSAWAAPRSPRVKIKGII